MKRFGAILLLTVALAGCGQASQSASNPSPTQNAAATQTAAPEKKGPPKIPHKLDDQHKVCKDCHTSGTNGAPVSPHPNRANCTSCHQAAE